MCQLPINNPELMRPINGLMRAGIKIVEFNTRFRRPIIEVDRPFKAWERGAAEITETRNGVQSVVKMTIWRGAHIIWR
ncbi:hypothetical protein [Obesumbacterium proteus]|uniref:Uncharacterized protein n=1 Tax=Obesumbacterium proteus ATCC 12841 TaxID=1354268 RepID=A0AA91EE41_9GAMM|nr:hypothetical protein [Obesumbacterium proteus]AMO79746.1 hypothetical protein DSM2777_00905 [Obesumbacterium proteus]OAT59010.1 hypothetical protein M993_02313 [Obesumbacterium proteus ATCC 12841]